MMIMLILTSENFKQGLAMVVMKKVSGHKLQIGGHQHSGWLPVGAAHPVPTPVREVIFDLEIQFDGGGYLLCYVSQEGDIYGDTWHETIREAEETALEDFGVSMDAWKQAQEEQAE